MKNERYAIALPGFIRPILLECVSVDGLLAARWAVNCKFARAVAANGYFSPRVNRSAYVNVRVRVDVSQRPRLGALVNYEELNLCDADAKTEFDRVCAEGDEFLVCIDPDRRPSVDSGWSDANGAIHEMCFVDVYETQACRKPDCRACLVWGKIDAVAAGMAIGE